MVVPFVVVFQMNVFVVIAIIVVVLVAHVGMSNSI